MDFSLSDVQETLRTEIRRFASEELCEGIEERDREPTFPRELWRRCGTRRIQGLAVPEAHGGRGLDSLSCAVALEALGYGCEDAGLVFSVGAHLLACTVPIWKHGSEEQKARYLSRLCDGSVIAANAMTEPEAGSDAAAIQTRAVPDGDGFRIDGTKTLCTNAPVADLALVFAVTDPEKGFQGGTTAFLVDRETPGYRVGGTLETMGHRSAPVGELTLNDVYVPADAVLGAVGAGAVIFGEAMSWERIGLFAAHLGAMERLLEQSITYARRRKQFGQPIGKFQAVSHRLVDMRVRLEAARLLTYRAASRLDRSRDAAMHAAMVKLFVSESLVQSTLDALQVHGGSGYLAGSPVERATRDALGTTLYSGTSEIQRNIIARWLGL